MSTIADKKIIDEMRVYMEYSGSEIINAMREVVWEHGKGVEFDTMVEEIPHTGHYPYYCEYDTRSFLTFITNELGDFMNDRDTYFKDGIFYVTEYMN
ncbi:unnamed protein product [Pylaiella littoralis]